MQNNGAGWFRAGQYRYKDTGESFKGTPKQITLGPGEVKCLDGSGRELLPVGHKEPQPATTEQLFYNGSWREQ